MSTIIVPTIEPTCVSYNPDTSGGSCPSEKEAEGNLDFIVTFLNLPQAMGDTNNYTERSISPFGLSENCVESTSGSSLMQALDGDMLNASNNNNIDKNNENNCSSSTETFEEAKETSPRTTATINRTTGPIDETNEGDENGDADDDSDEEELTNLTWLTELRNQSITWPSSINPTILDDNNDSPVAAGDHGVVSSDAMDLNTPLDRAAPGQVAKTSIGAKAGVSGIHRTGGGSETKLSSGSSGVAKAGGGSQAQVKRPTPAERYQIFMDKVKRDLQEYEQSAVNYQTDSSEKPPFNYSHIIGMAMLEKGRVTLQQICSWIESKFAFFRVRKKWNNSIRHNLSLHHCFRKINRNKYEKGKGGYWELGVDPKKCDRKRIRNRKSANLMNKKSPQSPESPHTNSSFDIQSMATAAAAVLTPASHDFVDGGLDMEQTEELMLDDLDVQHNIDISSNQPQQLHSNLDQQLQQEDAFIAGVLANCMEIDGSTDVVDVNNEMNTTTTTSTAAPTITNDNTVNLSHYQLGTVIISTSAEEVAAAMDVTTTLNSLIYDNNTAGNNTDNNNEYCQSQQHKILYREDEIPPACENVIISSFLGDPIDPHSHTIPKRPNVIVEPLEPYYSVISASANTLVSASGDCSTVAGDHFRPYIDGIDEAFQYLRSMDNNRSEDLLDNLLDISVSDY